MIPSISDRPSRAGADAAAGRSAGHRARRSRRPPEPEACAPELLKSAAAAAAETVPGQTHSARHLESISDSAAGRSLGLGSEPPLSLGVGHDDESELLRLDLDDVVELVRVRVLGETVVRRVLTELCAGAGSAVGGWGR